LTQNASVPIGQVLSFATDAAVSSFFGPASQEAILAAVYFSGFTGATQVPGALMFFQYASIAVAGWSRASVALTLAQVQAILPAVIPTSSIATTNGGTLTASTPSSGVITTGMLLTGTGVTAGTTITGQLTGVPGGAGTYSVSISQTTASTTITGAYQMTVAIDGSNVSAASLNLSAATSLSNAATLLGTALGLSGGQVCSYNSQLGQFQITSGTTGANSSVGVATGLGGVTLGFSTGASVSPGSAAMTEAGAMNSVTAITQNWAPFMTVWEPNLASKQNFAAWTVAQNLRYMYVAWDSDVNAITANNTTSFGPLMNALGDSGVVPIGGDTAVATALGVTLASLVATHAAFVCGTTAAINFSQTNGRITYAGKGQAGLQYAVNNVTSATNLQANGYNFYGTYATANATFTQFQPGSTPGVWKWIDSYINQIYMNSQFQLAGMNLLSNTNSIPFNTAGYQTVRDTYTPVATQMLNFGAIRQNVALSAAQTNNVNNQAGVNIAPTLETEGWYLQIVPATSQVRGTRGPLQVNFWYMDGGSVQKMNIASIDVM